MSDKFELTEQGQKLLEKRYLHPGETTWQDVCKRVVGFLYPEEETNFNQDKLYLDLMDYMSKGYIIPNTPCLINAGKEEAQLSACFLLPIEDNMDSIFGTLHDAAKIFKSGGGVGFDFSNLRPEGSTVSTTSGIASGPISFMKIYDSAINEIKQGGVRRGAAMATLRIDHPDIVKFIKCKHIDGVISNFNISVAITDEFMELLGEHQDPDKMDGYMWTCRFGEKEYYINKKTSSPEEYSPALLIDNYYSVEDIWNLIVKHAWTNGDPGVIFIDEIRRKNGEEIQGVNPCSELPLRPYEACCLASIDLSKMLRQDQECIPTRAFSLQIDWQLLEHIVQAGVDMLNAMIDRGTYPLSQIEEKVKETRKIGLGVMGWADLLLKLGIKYGSQESIEAAEEVMQFINRVAHEYSEGKNYNNSTLTTVAPTGSISQIAGCSSGIEPIYEWTTIHNRQDFEEQIITHKLAKEFINPETGDMILPDYFVTTNDITPTAHVRMQAAFQKELDNGVSKTINMSENASVKDVEHALKLAWTLKCKGITVYRDESRANQVLSRQTKKAVKSRDILNDERPYVVPGKIFKVKVEVGNGRVENVYIVIGIEPTTNEPFEVFVAGNIRGMDRIVAEAIDTTTRLTSLSMRAGTPLIKVIEQLNKVPGTTLYSLPNKLANVLSEFLMENDLPKCPDCQGNVIFSEGCIKCQLCSWSRCG